MKIVLTHGIRTTDPDKTLGSLFVDLESRNFSVTYSMYGYILFPLNNKRGVNSLIETACDGDILVGYSNGADIIRRAIEKGLKPTHVVLISPALRMNTNFNVPTTCFYSEGDRVLSWGRRWGFATSLLPHRWGTPHGWGRMGRYGADDENIENICMGEKIGHSFYKHPKVVNQIADKIESIYWQNYKEFI